MKNIVLFLDVDGVLNQYDNHERMKRYKISEKDGFSEETDEFNPYQKKVKRLAKLVKTFNIDVYVFSAWTEGNLQPHLPFKLKGDTGKWIKNVNKIAEDYKYSILIDDEISAILLNGTNCSEERLNENILTYQPYFNHGLVSKDFRKLEKIFSFFNV